ncbi:hypothetical protein [Natranaerofaba carboxydovora]|nr:hypothetical protein [Natranaerofaba carboxydovora]
MEFVFVAIIVVLILFGIYTLGFVIPRQLKEILDELKSIKALLKEKKGTN